MNMKSGISPTPSCSPSALGIQNYRGTNSPLPPPLAYSTSCMTAAAKRYKYLRRLLKFHQMDFEFALWQMLYLFVAPQKVYRNFYYRKQTKSQFARDDPAFLVLLTLWLIGSSIGFSFVLQLDFFQFIKFTLYVIVVDCIGVGVCTATILWHFSNKYLKKSTCEDQDVEWGYAFDVHLNAFFPLLIVLHVLQLFFYNVLISHEWFISLLFGNSLWAVAVGYYIYITFLGYSSLPILQRTHVLLYPLTALALIFIVTLAIGWNLSDSGVTLLYNSFENEKPYPEGKPPGPVTPKMLVKSLKRLNKTSFKKLIFTPREVTWEILKTYPQVEQDAQNLFLEVSDKLYCAAAAGLVGTKHDLGYYAFHMGQREINTRSELMFWILYKKILKRNGVNKTLAKEKEFVLTQKKKEEIISVRH